MLCLFNMDSKNGMVEVCHKFVWTTRLRYIVEQRVENGTFTLADCDKLWEELPTIYLVCRATGKVFVPIQVNEFIDE